MSTPQSYNKVDSASPLNAKDSAVKANIQALADLFPSAVQEGVVDFDALTRILGGKTEPQPERFGLNWCGKAAAHAGALVDSAGTLRPCREESKDWDTTKNLYIEGDNLEVLKLLRNSYRGKVKMIYIDPPYNTGKDFVYKDNFHDSIKNYQQITGQQNELKENSETSGRYHTDWLNMMYPRLVLARELLSEDGVIFISIDDNEYHNLCKICNEIFGAENHLETFHIQVRYGNKSLNERDDFQKLIEYTLIYSKSRKYFTPKKETTEYDLTKFNLNITEIKSPDKHLSIHGREVDIFLPGSYSIEAVSDEETASMDFFKETWVTGSIYSGTGHGLVYQQVVEPRGQEDGLGVLYKIHGLGEDGLGFRYMTGPKQASSRFGKMYNKIPLDKLEGLKAGTYRKSKPILNFYDYSPDYGNIRHEGGIAFNGGKKPVKMLRKLLEMINQDDFICLDFFSGSASTAHAVMQLNAEDGGNRRFIMVQLPEPCDEKSEAHKEGFKNICEIGKERIRRAGEKVKTGAGDKAKDLDIGFRVYKLDSSNVYAWDPDTRDIGKSLEEAANHLKADRSAEDIMTELMLRFGIMLTNNVEKQECGDTGLEVYNIGCGRHFACLDENLAEHAEDVAHFILEWHKRENPGTHEEEAKDCQVFVVDKAFVGNDAAKKNFCAILSDYGIKQVNAF